MIKTKLFVIIFYFSFHNSDLDDCIKNTDELFNGFWEIDPNTVTTILTIINGWSGNIKNAPDDFSQTWGLLITVWYYTGTGSLTATRMQTLFYNGKCSSRYYDSEDGWSQWGHT